MQPENPPSAAPPPGAPPPGNPVWVMAPPPPRRRFGLIGTFGVLVGGVFLGSTCSTCATMQANQEGPFAPDGPRIGVVEVMGAINASRETVEQLSRFSHDDRIEAVVLRVDSPGGSVGPSQEIYEAVRRTAEVKPVVASMGAVAASGGFWISLGADEVFANPGSITGSIGVIVQIPDLTGVAEMLRFDMRTYKSGPQKDLGNPLRPEREGDKLIFQRLVEDVYDQFVSLTAERRGLQREKVLALADGRILTGRDAKQAGLVDRLGGLETAARRALELAREKKEETLDADAVPVLVYPPEPVPPLLQMLGATVADGVGRGVRAAISESLDAASEPGVELR